MQLNSKVETVSAFDITLETVKKEVAKRKNWTVPPVIDGVQNFWWKKFEALQKALTKVLIELKQDNNQIPVWWSAGRTVLLPKTNNLSDEKNHRPITCLNSSSKILTSLIAKYMREHTIFNNIWDEGQLGALEDVLGTIDQLIIDN